MYAVYRARNYFTHHIDAEVIIMDMRLIWNSSKKYAYAGFLLLFNDSG